jgi:hypothetical protein
LRHGRQDNNWVGVPVCELLSLLSDMLSISLEIMVTCIVEKFQIVSDQRYAIVSTPQIFSFRCNWYLKLKLKNGKRNPITKSGLDSDATDDVGQFG